MMGKNNNNLLITASINFDLRYLTLNYILNIFFNKQFVLERFSL